MWFWRKVNKIWSDRKIDEAVLQDANALLGHNMEADNGNTVTCHSWRRLR